MASFAQSRAGGGGAKTISACILTGVVRVLDFALLLAAAWLAAIGVGAWLETPLRGLLALAATIGAGMGCIALASEGGREFIERLQAEPDAFEIVGVYDDRLHPDRVSSVHANVPVRGTVAELVRDSRQEKVDVIAVALPLSAVQRIADILEQLSSTVADVCLTADLAGLTYRDDQFGAVGTNPVISIGEDPLKDWQVAYKACFDYVVGAIALVILSPLLALLALAIRLDSKGPILFRQPRLGFNNRIFICYKFRTMYADKMDVLADRLTMRGDPRITRIGKWMRKFSLDELPQLINVINGTMSLVGPRPHATNAKAADRLLGPGQWLARRDGHSGADRK